MRVSRNKDITIELPLHIAQSFNATPRDNLVTVSDPNLEVTELDNLLLGQVREIIKVALGGVSALRVARDRLDPVHGLA